MHDLGPGAAVALLEHRLVDDERRFDVLGGVADVPPVPPGTVRVPGLHQARVVAGLLLAADVPRPPLQVAGISTALV